MAGGINLSLAVKNSRFDKDIQKQIKRLGEIKSEKIPRAINDALNATGKLIRTEIRSKGGKKLKINVGTISRRVSMRPSNIKTLRAKIFIRKNDIPALFLAFNAKKGQKVDFSKFVKFDKGLKSSSKNRPRTGLKGLSIGNGINRRFYRNGFIANVKGSPQILTRVSNKSRPLRFPMVPIEKELLAITPAIIKRRLREDFSRNLTGQLKRRINEVVNK